MFYMSEMPTLIIKSTMLWSCSLERDTPGMASVQSSFVPWVFDQIFNCVFSFAKPSFNEGTAVYFQ